MLKSSGQNTFKKTKQFYMDEMGALESDIFISSGSAIFVQKTFCLVFIPNLYLLQLHMFYLFKYFHIIIISCKLSYFDFNSRSHYH